MKGWKPAKNRGVSGARKRQQAHGDHSVSRVKQKKGPEAQKTSMAWGGNKTVGLGDKRPMPDNRGGSLKG